MGILLCQREDGAYVGKMSVDFPDEIREEDDKQESQGKGKVAPAQCSGRKHYCCEQGYGDQQRAPQWVSAQCSYRHEEVDDSWRVSDVDRGCIACDWQQAMMHGIVCHAVELDLVIIQLGGIDLVEAQESSDQ